MTIVEVDLQDESGKTDETGQTSAREGSSLASTGGRDGGRNSLGGGNDGSVLARAIGFQLEQKFFLIMYQK